MFLKFAWRNIWRNRRRSWITIASVAFAVFFSGIMQAIQEGSWDNMIDNVASSYMGNVQIHLKGYWENPSINELLEHSKDELLAVHNHEEVQHAVPRLESVALISTGENTRGAMVLGVSAHAEEAMSKMSLKLQEGNYFQDNKPTVLLGDALARQIGSHIGDTVYLISQGYHGANAAGMFPVSGILHFPSPQLNRQMVMMRLQDAQYFYGAENRISSIVIKTTDQRAERELIPVLEQYYDTSRYEVLGLGKLMPDLIKSKEVDASGNYIIFFILYMIIAFGIFGTLMMMMMERKYELGVLISIGMERIKIFRMIWMELILLGMIGALVGIVLAYSGAWYFHQNPIVLTGDFASAMENFDFEPIIPAAVTPRIFLTHGVIVFILCVLISLFPLFRILKLNPVKAMRA